MKQNNLKICGCLFAIIGIAITATSFAFLIQTGQTALVAGVFGGFILLVIALAGCCRAHGGKSHTKQGQIIHIPGHYDNNDHWIPEIVYSVDQGTNSFSNNDVYSSGVVDSSTTGGGESGGCSGGDSGGGGGGDSGGGTCD